MRRSDSKSEPLGARLTGWEWRLIEDGAAAGIWNMAVDDALLEAARRDETPPTLRLYGWLRPTLSLGRHQDPCQGIDHAYRRARGIDLVRRPTGGRAVLHDQEVTYSITLPASLSRGAGVGEVYCTLSKALLGGLEWVLGVQGFRGSGVGEGPPEHLNTRTPEHPNMASCFAGAAGGDGLVAAGKLVGSAQARRAGAVLQHGSVLIEARREEWHGLFGSSGLETALADLVQPPPSVERVREALRHGLEASLAARWRPAGLTAAEQSEAERLMAERYGVGCLD
jgi:lipoyl(octanoyl) transferase